VPQLLVWQDANENGVSEAGELSTLAEAGIASISLNTSAPAPGEETIAGHEIAAVSAVTYDDASTSAAAARNATRNTPRGRRRRAAVGRRLPPLTGRPRAAVAPAA
jgi:hypothetical protein